MTKRVDTKVGTIKLVGNTKKIFLYNPKNGLRRWYNYGAKVTAIGKEVFKELQDSLNTTASGVTKASVLRNNIQKVLEYIRQADSMIEGVDNLIDKIDSKLDEMSDYEIEKFSEENSRAINLYFEYMDVNISGVDARLLKLAKALDIDVYDYIETEKVPNEVQNILINLEHVVAFDKDFDNIDGEFTGKVGRAFKVDKNTTRHNLVIRDINIK